MEFVAIMMVLTMDAKDVAVFDPHNEMKAISRDKAPSVHKTTV